ncbi:MAG: hypothetical protein VXX72_08345 [Pseudomonadota bacterium]|nr:hypothetical protein [Pseudomonadota bacterium]
MAPRRRRRKSKGNLDIAKSIRRNVDESVVTALRKASVEIMNDLAKQGPGYSGEFSSAWYAVPPGGSPGGNRSTDRMYTYDLRNVPKARFKNLKEGTVYEIVNGMDYAPQALDLEPGEFFQPDEEPIKKPVNRGTRTGSFRYEVVGQEAIGAVSTAEANWYNTYSQGGSLKKSFEQGVKLGFKRAAKTTGGGFS